MPQECYGVRLTAEGSKRLVRRCCFLRPCFLLFAFLLVTFPSETWENFAVSASWRGGKYSAQRAILFGVLHLLWCVTSSFPSSLFALAASNLRNLRNYWFPKSGCIFQPLLRARMSPFYFSIP